MTKYARTEELRVSQFLLPTSYLQSTDEVCTEEFGVAAEEGAPSHEPHGLCDLAPRELVVLREAVGLGLGSGLG